MTDDQLNQLTDALADDRDFIDTLRRMEARVKPRDPMDPLDIRSMLDRLADVRAVTLAIALSDETPREQKIDALVEWKAWARRVDEAMLRELERWQPEGKAD